MTPRIFLPLLLGISVAFSQRQDIVTSPDSRDSLWVWYEFRPLGIKFKSFSDFHQPFDLSDTRSHDMSTWKYFDLPRRGISFRYPSTLTATVVESSNDYPSECDSVIQLVAPLVKHFSEDGSEDSVEVTVAPVIEVFFTRSDLKQIAHAEGFEFGALHNPFAPDDSAALRDTSSYCWIVLGRQGMEEEASVLDGLVWKGLRGENLTGLYSRTQGYLMSVPFVASFLMRPISDGCFVVVKFYEGPQLYKEDQFDTTIFEGDFYYVVLSMRISAR